MICRATRYDTRRSDCRACGSGQDAMGLVLMAEGKALLTDDDLHDLRKGG